MNYEEARSDLLRKIQDDHRLLFNNLNKIPKERWLEPVINKWNIKDILAQILERQNMVKLWYDTGKTGEIPEIPMSGYKWNQIDEVYEIIYLQYKDHALEEILKLFDISHRSMISIIENEKAENIFTRGAYPWLKDTYLRSFLSPNTSGQYKWAKTEIRKWANNEGII